MGEIVFTKEQQRVIDERGSELLVSAAAGSGKTAVLVERILGLITDEKNPSSLDRLLIMTFTNAAADGMRQKIKEAVSKRAAECTNRKMREHLKTQEALLPRARITTIHAFCQSLIRQYFQYLDIDPAFRVADAGELKLLKADTAAELLEESFEAGDQDFLSTADIFSKTGLDENLSDLIIYIAGQAEGRPWPARYLRENLLNLKTETEKGFEAAPWYGIFLKEITGKAEEKLALLNEALLMSAAPDGWKPHEEYLTYLRDFYVSLRDALIKDVSGSYERIQQVLSGYHPPERISAKKCPQGSTEKRDAERAVIENARAYIKEVLFSYFELSKELMENVSRGSGRDLTVLLTLALSFTERLNEKKKSRGIIDFSDMEHLCLELLYEEKDGKMVYSRLADMLSEGYDEILIDEYQDSNDVQEYIVKALDARRFGRPDIFMVGDVKQSIYSFRRAKPELFMGKYETFKEEGGDSIKIELNKNFRSRREVTQSVNDVFESIMIKEAGGITYDEKCALHCGRTEEKDTDLKTELLLLEENGAAPANDADDDSVSAERLSCYMMASRIKELTEGENARFKKGDITILLRSGKKADELVDALREAGIESSFDSGSGYFTAPEVSMVLSFLEVIDNPYNDIPLAALLRGPIYGFTDEELASLKADYGKENTLPFYEVIKSAASDNKKAQDFLSDLSEYRRLSQKISVHRLINHIYVNTGYYDYVSALPGGSRRRKNLDMLLEKAESYMASSYRGLFNFIRYIDQIKKYDSDYGEAPEAGTAGNIVNITTIHRSKGLEYPVTIIGSMEKQFNREDLKKNLVCDDLYGFSCDYTNPETRLRYPSLKSRLIKERMKEQSAGEELRVLYVGMTRAQEKLIMTGRLKNVEESIAKHEKKHPLPEDIISCRNPLEMLMLSGALSKGNIALKTYDCGTIETGEAESAERTVDIINGLYENVDGDLLLKLKKDIDAGYAHKEETGLKPKVSVSELKAEAIMEKETSFVTGLEEKRETKGAEFGTLLHSAFFKLDYSKEPGEDFPSGLKADGDTLKRIREMALKFRQSQLGQRMEEAYKSGKLFREKRFMAGFPACELMPSCRSEELLLLQGIIDAYIIEDGEITLIDYKTDRVDDENTLISRYALQLELYKKAISQLLRLPVKECIIWSTCLSREIRV